MRRLTLLLFLLLATPASADVVKQAPPGAFVSLHDVDPSIIVEMRYLTNHNFTTSVVKELKQDDVLLWTLHCKHLTMSKISTTQGVDRLAIS